MKEDNSNQKKCPAFSWVKRLGVGAFLFFFIKGLVWVAVFMGLAEFISCG